MTITTPPSDIYEARERWRMAVDLTEPWHEGWCTSKHADPCGCRYHLARVLHMLVREHRPEQKVSYKLCPPHREVPLFAALSDPCSDCVMNPRVVCAECEGTWPCDTVFPVLSAKGKVSVLDLTPQPEPVRGELG